MIKSFLIITSLKILLFSSQQIVLVVSDDFSNQDAKLELYEDGKKLYKTIDVKIGKNGLGWGLGEKSIKYSKDDVLKYEGDKKAPAGIFKLTDIYGYSSQHNYKMPYLYTSNNLICVDDSNSPFYNHIIEATGNEKSYENMKREDDQYELGIVVAHNSSGIKKRGSCIFLHVKKEDDSPTAGCTAMNLEEIQYISTWLDHKKSPILIQIPKSYSQKVLELYPELKSSKLLK